MRQLKGIDIEIDMSYPDVEFEEPVAFTMMKFVKRRLNFGKTIKKISNRNAKNATPQTPQTPENSMSEYEVNDDTFINNMRLLETAISSGDFESVSDLFSDEGYESFMKLKSYGTASVIGTPDYKLFIFNNEVLCRSLPMRFAFNKTAFTRDVVFRFDKDTKLITSLAFRLSDTAEKCVWDRDEWKIDSRLVLINFLEDYQTAYAFKQLEYLDKIFSENALVIVGHVIENKPVTENNIAYCNNKKVKLTMKTKAEYLESLSKNFRCKSYINIHFTDLEVRRAAGEDEEVFGVQVRQYYYSNNYNDEGYLFLMVDLRQELPIIHVRTWQPGKTDIEELITLRDVL